MPRKARKLSTTGIYHTMLRGVNKQMIFEDATDYDYFLEILRECKELCSFKIYAYCLMGNHVHLLLQVQENNLEEIFKRIAGRYVYYFNLKYQRVGHLFQDRFKSEPVEDDSYLITVLRYIHQNPVKAKLCKRVEEYRYSSMEKYLCNSELVDAKFIFSILPQDDFLTFNNTPNSDMCLEVVSSPRRGVTDAQAQVIIQKVSRCQSMAEFQGLDEKKKARCMKKIHEKGVSIRQISRLTGISKGVVERLLKVK